MGKMARIMLVDDAMFMRATLKKMVEEGGHSVVCEAGTGAEAVELYKIHTPDIVLMDITMPDMDGIQATEAIMKLNKDARIIMVSALGQMEMVVKAISTGAKDFIVKPMEKGKLLSCISKYL